MDREAGSSEGRQEVKCGSWEAGADWEEGRRKRGRSLIIFLSAPFSFSLELRQAMKFLMGSFKKNIYQHKTP